MMKRFVLGAVAVLSFAVAVPPQPAAAQSGEGLQGTWIFTDAEGQQRGLFIFTATDYSQMWVRGDQPRAVLPENPTLEQRFASVNEVTANSGRYRIEGDQLTYEAYMANSAAYMAAWPDNDRTVTVKVDGDTLTWIDGDRTFIMRRVN